jgi:hypothetical protein
MNRRIPLVTPVIYDSKPRSDFGSATDGILKIHIISPGTPACKRPEW